MYTAGVKPASVRDRNVLFSNIFIGRGKKREKKPQIFWPKSGPKRGEKGPGF
jgi:hypothetical protein